MEQHPKRQTEVKVQLFITHFECSPDEITRILGITPTATWLQGEPIPKSAGGVRKVNGWKLQSPTFPLGGPEEQTDALLNVITPHAWRFKNLPGGSAIELSCAIYAYDDTHRVFEFSSDVVRRLAEIGMSIDVAYYAFTSCSEDATE